MELLEKEITKLANSLPELPKRPRRNLYDILGVQNKEVINSRVLAYFFDTEEEHSFKSLFFDALVEILLEKGAIDLNGNFFSGEFKVFTEDTTYYAEGEDQQNKRIDITIKGDDWCIIIENKLYHHLSNPLKAYWEHAKGYSKKERIMGIVLSLDAKSEKECTEEDVTFINVTHEELINKVQSILKLSNIDDDTDIFYLREYIRTIKTHYWHKMDTPQMNVLVQALIDQSEAMKIIETNKNRAVEFIERQIQEVFAFRGYKKVRQWFCHPKNENLCFYVAPTHEILENNHLGLGFEVFNKLKDDLGDDILKIKNAIESKNLGNNFYFDKVRNTGNMSRIVTYRKPDFLSGGTDIKSELENVLDTYFFNEDGIEATVLKLFPQSIALKRAMEY